MLYYTDLEEKVFEKSYSPSIDSVAIISGYVGIEPIERLETLPNNIHATVIYGMYGSENISAPLHKALVELQNKLPNVEILYSTVPVHSKIYFWEEGDDIKSALIGSANFSVKGLRNDYREVLSDVDEEDFSDFKTYYDYVRKRSLKCTDERIIVRKMSKGYRTSKNLQTLLAKGICRASFLDRKGFVPKKSGLNWGFSRGHVKEGDAYIPITMENIRNFPNMFPPKKYVYGNENTNSTGRKNRENDEVEMIWDDGTFMTGLLEGQHAVKEDNIIYPKQLSSSPQKSILGDYLRKRIGVPKNHVITKTDLKKYGRYSVDISLIGEGIYYMDFSVNKK